MKPTPISVAPPIEAQTLEEQAIGTQIIGTQIVETQTTGPRSGRSYDCRTMSKRCF